MNLDEILKEWEADSVIARIGLDEVSRDTPKLHAKYLRQYAIVKLKLKDAEHAQKRLLRDKWMYYNGKMDEDAMLERGWDFDPFDGLKIQKTNLPYWFNADEELQRSEEKIEYLKTCETTLKEIIDNIKWRHQTIKNMIEWRKFEMGA